MNDKLNLLIAKIKELESEIVAEIHEREKQFGYEIQGTRVRFSKAIEAQHRKVAKSLVRYLRESRLMCIVSAPVIWACVVPAILLHVAANVYQFVCFPIYGIPKVRRQDYFVMDRGHLLYLNSIQRLNCLYCEYANGMLAYVQEIAGRTEQYWCPIKHALNLKTRHSRYQRFLDFGDAEEFHKRFEDVRKDFADLKKKSE